MREEINKIHKQNDKQIEQIHKKTMSGLKPFFPSIDKHPENPQQKSTRQRWK
jgi:hypothetical protein